MVHLEERRGERVGLVLVDHDALEREGDVEAGKQRGPPKKPVALLRAGAKVRLGVKLGPSLKLGALGRL